MKFFRDGFSNLRVVVIFDDILIMLRVFFEWKWNIWCLVIFVFVVGFFFILYFYILVINWMKYMNILFNLYIKYVD